MDAVLAITGQGGWPLSVFLTPELLPFYGGTYFHLNPALVCHPSMNILFEISKKWENDPRGIHKTSEKIYRSLINKNTRRIFFRQVRRSILSFQICKIPHRLL